MTGRRTDPWVTPDHSQPRKDTMTIPPWDAPSYKCAHWETFGFDAKELSAQERDTVELKATHRGPAYDLVLISIDRKGVFVSVEDAERFASAILTVAAKARQHIAQQERAKREKEQAQKAKAMEAPNGALF